MQTMKKDKIVNKRARFEYEIVDEIEAGLVLSGPEVKSLRLGRGGLTDAFVRVTDGEAFLVNASIPLYAFADLPEYDPKRSRKLLLHKKQIESLEQKAQTKKLSLVPLSIYVKGGVFKVLVGLGKGRKTYEKKELLKRRDLEREARRDLKNR